MRARLVFATALILGAATAGCFDYLSDEGIVRQSGAGTGGTSGTGGTGGGTGGTGGMTTTAPPECVPGNAAMPVEDSCGIFVSESKGDDMKGKGTKDSPVKSLTKGIDLATKEGKPVYMCGETFTGPIQLGVSSLIYGALDCTKDWKFLGDAGRTVITAATDMVPLQIQDGANIEMHDINVTAVDSEALGGSSIAITAAAATSLSLFNSDVAAGTGHAGVDAQAIGGTGADGTVGSVGVDACTTSQAVTPEPPATACGMDQSVGGIGGQGGVNAAGSGTAGEPDSETHMNLGGGETNNNPCGNGKDGNTDPHDGVGGLGAAGSLGALSAGKGFVGTAGGDGQAGKPGQGGGGGGGSRGGTGSGKCLDGTKASGASGGSGGSGGCGGQGGKGGGGGGASIAIATFGATLAFEKVNLSVKDGGRGGFGGDGQGGGIGQAGGAGGKADGFGNLYPGCKGGTGANGGKGGTGGGGMGGHSIGIAYKGGTAPDTTGVTITLGKPGGGGTGDGTDQGKGADGVAKETQSF